MAETFEILANSWRLVPCVTPETMKTAIQKELTRLEDHLRVLVTSVVTHGLTVSLKNPPHIG